ncbi:hypothetical protein [Nocardia crassostreae]|nr:hypothetical protein [Nocardia crassostreae]
MPTGDRPGRRTVVAGPAVLTRVEMRHESCVETRWDVPGLGNNGP